MDCGAAMGLGRRLQYRVALIATVMLLAVDGSTPPQAQGTDDLAGLRKQAAELYRAGKYPEATELVKRSLALAERQYGPDHPDVGALLNNLATLHQAQGRYLEAEPLFKRALAIAEKARGPDHADVGTALNNLALLYRVQGRYVEAEPLYQRALAVREKALGPDHLDLASSLNNLALLYQARGRYIEAEPLLKRALVVAEKALGANHARVGTALNNLGDLYRVQGRPAEAEPLYRRALAVAEKALGPDHPDVGTYLSNLAVLYGAEGRYADAEPLHKRALAVREKALGVDHPLVSLSLNNLAELYRMRGRYPEAEPLYRRALASYERALGSDHPDLGTPLNNLAFLYQDQGRYAEAEQLYQRALMIREKALGPDHPSVGASLHNLAGLHLAQRDWVRAAELWRRSTAVLTRRAQRGTADIGQTLTGKTKDEPEQLRGEFWGLLKVVHRLVSDKGGDQTSLGREMFQTAQWAQHSEAAASLSQMATRGAKGDLALSALVRERQDLVEDWQERDAARSAAVAQAPDKRDRAAEAGNAARLAAIDARITDIDKRLAADFPDYAALARPAPLTVEDVQAQLRTNEALVLFLDTPAWKPTPEETFIWVITRTDMRWVRSELGTLSLAREVGALRCGLDAAAWDDDGARCAALLKRAPPTGNEQLPFDTTRAHALYKSLFGEVGDLIRDKHLLVVPAGPLTQLPFPVLVTAPSTANDYKSAAWLARQNAITVLPAVSSLKALRRVAQPSAATKPMIGFGNPLLDGPNSYYEELKQAALKRQSCGGLGKVPLAVNRGRGGAKPFAQRGGIASVADLRMASPLPETAEELCDVAKAIGADEADIFLGARASEREIKQLNEADTLRGYRIVHFATHGALAGEISGSAEAGLILTPPNDGTKADDGYLSASEIASLRLDADWVILSACNTAAGGTQGAEALSGLARAFFYAGARALLVSHWAVDWPPPLS